MKREASWELLRELEAMIFGEHWMTEDKFQRLLRSQPILLVAYDGDKAIGYKVGFQRDGQTFHSWLGGVHADYRKQGIGQRLLERQEELVRDLGYGRITFNTFKKYANMIRLGEKNGYRLLKTEHVDGDQKFFYAKDLTP